jgi:Na+/melibiose symporter-like transporter
MATTVGTMSNPLGVAIGFVLPAIIVTASKSKSQIVLLMFVEAIICSVVLVLAIIMFKNLPKYPPSLSASQSREEFMPALKAVFKNKSFLLLLLAYSMGQGALNALATLIDLISKPYGFSTFDNSVFGGLLIICGLIGAGIVGTIVTITHKYKLTCIIMCFGTVATFFGFIFTLEFESLIISSVTIGLVGLILTPILPISYEFGIELTYPVGEAMTGGILNSGGQIIGISEVGLAYLLVNQPVIICIICAAGIGIGGIALIFVKEELQRAGIDNSASANFISLKEAE